MKYIYTILLLASVGIQTFSKWIIILNYEINKNYIAANLCENRNKKNCACHGKCYLHKKLVADEDQQRPYGKNDNSKNTTVELFLEKDQKITIENISAHTSLHSYYYRGKLQEFNTVVFQPPQHAV